MGMMLGGVIVALGVVHQDAAIAVSGAALTALMTLFRWMWSEIPTVEDEY